jgi:hypothetical protein
VSKYKEKEMWVFFYFFFSVGVSFSEPQIHRRNSFSVSGFLLIKKKKNPLTSPPPPNKNYKGKRKEIREIPILFFY